MIVLGVDGMDPEFLEAHWAQLPNLHRLSQEGDFKRLATSIPPQSPVAWSSVITGMDPGGHGIFDFIHRDPATRMPFSSTAETTAPSHALTIGPYIFPLSGGGVHSLRSGRAFWQILADHGVRASVIRMPANYPPADCDFDDTLSGMGTPDMQGSFGTFTFFTNDPGETRTHVPGGQIVAIRLVNGHADLPVAGPVNAFRKERPVSSVTLAIDADPTEPVVRVSIDDYQAILKQGEWSDWIHARFRLLPLVKSAAGMFRVYVQQVHPYLRVYASPVNIDPSDPELPIATPASYSRELADALGPFYTQGIPEESSALRAGILNRKEFLVQSHRVLADSLRMLHYELEHFDSGLLFFYFSSVDQNSHMLWGKYDDDLLQIYEGIDEAVGEAMAKATPGTTLIVMSDHGFARFDRAVNLNSWLMREGFLALDNPANTGDQELFPHVDWSKTQAYAMGLNGIFLNLEGREPGGIVSASERADVLNRIADRLKCLRDPKTGAQAVKEVYFSETAYRGRNTRLSPDLIVGFRRGYRASWQTTLGAVPKEIIEDNTQAWIGDHCMAADQVPGVLLSNRKVRAPAPQLYDITTTILAEFGVGPGQGMIGRSVL